MPWQNAAKPSPVLAAALAAFLKRSNPPIRVHCRNDHFGIAARIGRLFYGILTSGPMMKYAELLAFPALCPERAEACIEHVAQRFAA